MRWGLIGGGRGSQIGEAHRIAARLDGLFIFSAGALDVDAAAGRAFGRELGLAGDRSYGDWREMLKAESARPKAEHLDLVTVATPNATHYEITKAFLEAGFNVLCEKPLTMNVEEADDLCATAASTGKICAVNFGYSGYPMAIEARAMIAAGELGDVRVVMAEFAHGAHADANDAENPRVRWRYDPAQAGISSVVADIGVHVLQMAQFMTGQKVTSLTAQFEHSIPSRELEDDALLSCRFDKGAVGRVWLSAVATGQPHGFVVRVFGSKGGLRWSQEHPDQLQFTPLGGSTQIVQRGDARHPASVAASRLTVGHSEGMLVAFANIYRGIHARIGGGAGAGGERGYPDVSEGAEMVRAVHAAVRSAKDRGAWIDTRTLAAV